MKKILPLLIAAAFASPVAMAHQAGDILVRGGLAFVSPQTSSDNVLGTGELEIDSNVQLGLTLSYMLTDNWGVELLAAPPFALSVSTAGLGGVAKVKHLPPTLMAQYYFGDANSKVRPYVGAGINYTTFFNEDFNDTGKAAGLSDLSLKDSWGAAGQVGLDYLINRDWLLNMSVWYMDIDTDVKFKANGVDQKVSTRLDPWVFMFSAGYRF